MDSIRDQRARRYFEESNLDTPYWSFDKQKLVAESDKTAFRRLAHIEQNIVQWVSNGQNILIWSSVSGNGKTSWARRLLLRYLYESLEENRVNAGVFLSFFEFLDRQRDLMGGWDEKFPVLKRRLITADLVVWDDFGTAQLSEFAVASIGNIVDTRINRKLSNVYTTNFDPQSSAFKNRLGMRVWDRVVNLSECLEFVGEGRRRVGNAANLV